MVIAVLRRRFTLFGGSGDAGADLQEGCGSVLAAPEPGGFLLEFDHAHVAFGLGVGEQDGEGVSGTALEAD